MEADLFLTLFGLDAIHRQRHKHSKLATVGNPGLHLATCAGGLPGVTSESTARAARPRPGVADLGWDIVGVAVLVLAAIDAGSVAAAGIWP